MWKFGDESRNLAAFSAAGAGKRMLALLSSPDEATACFAGDALYAAANASDIEKDDFRNSLTDDGESVVEAMIAHCNAVLRMRPDAAGESAAGTDAAEAAHEGGSGGRSEETGEATGEAKGDRTVLEGGEAGTSPVSYSRRSAAVFSFVCQALSTRLRAVFVEQLLADGTFGAFSDQAASMH